MNKLFLLFLGVVASLWLFQCSSDKTVEPVTVDPEGANALVQQNQAELQSALSSIAGNNFGYDSLKALDLNTAYNTYQAALAKDPNNSAARLGVGVLGLGKLKDDAQIQSSLDSIQAWTNSSNPPFFIDTNTAIPAAKKLDRLAKKLQILAVTNPPEIHELQDLLDAKVAGPVDSAIAQLKHIVENDPTFSYKLTFVVDGDTAKIDIDNGDVYAVLSGLTLMKAMISYITSYNLDVDQNGSYDAFNTEMASRDLLIALMQPNSDFLKVRTGKAASLLAIPGLLQGSIDYFDDAIDFVLAETDDQSDDVFTIDSTNRADIDDIRAGLDTARSWLAGPKTVSVKDVAGWDTLSTETFRVDLTKIFGITDFKALLPWHGFYPAGRWDDVMRADTQWNYFTNQYFNGTEYVTVTDSSYWVNTITRGPVYLLNAGGTDTTMFYLDDAGINPRISSLTSTDALTPAQMSVEMPKLIVLPDPTFGGVFPGMTAARLWQLIGLINDASNSPSNPANQMVVNVMPKKLEAEKVSPFAILTTLLP